MALVSAALQGYLLGFGNLGKGSGGYLARFGVGIAGLFLAVPSGGLFGFSQVLLLGGSAIFLTIGIGAAVLQRRALLVSES